jgi:serine phosphatase RsbU (regulator of sigma subunit)
VERLNHIIHESTLTSRFVSMFYGELEMHGAFIYVNCGHPPPWYLGADGREQPLEEGGTVLGPISDATYERGFVTMRPGPGEGR